MSGIGQRQITCWPRAVARFASRRLPKSSGLTRLSEGKARVAVGRLVARGLAPHARMQPVAVSPV